MLRRILDGACPRIAGRWLTGPFAFLLGGALDVALYAAAALRARSGTGRAGG